MNDLATIKLELNINAQRILSQYRTHSEEMEKQVEKGINLALEEIVANDNFVQRIKEATLKAVEGEVNKAIISWEVRGKISKIVEEKIGNKLNEFGDKIAENIVSALEK